MSQASAVRVWLVGDLGRLDWTHAWALEEMSAHLVDSQLLHC